MYDRYSNKKVLEYGKDNLEDKYPDFKYLMKEYHDGILHFKLTDELVWSKAVQDTLGLEKFYQEHKENYKWGERYKGSIYYCANNKIQKKLQKHLKSGKQIKNKMLLDKFNKKNKGNLKIVNGTFSKGKNEIVDFYIWNKGDYKENNKEFILLHGNKIEPAYKTINEAKGLITADYQTYLEKQWMVNLRKKYKITVNRNVLYSIK
jgi:peptidyl-prolyl cis-trans isomerase SurA